ncbi:hypothetical protein V1264_019756 [Littorina saxatilis]|uniref:Peroxidase n=1 Tax=Littorina saxatilis TaxID=31220 RepID=A0AAN9B9P0_9CAEN
MRLPCLPCQLTEHLFERRPRAGFDLVAFNIQRGRDHGLRPYNDVRRACGLGPINRFTDRRFNGSDLSSVYEFTDDVDLFVGGLLEPGYQGGLVGETFSCIIATQFFLLKYGDRYFFESNQRPEGFTERQLRQVRQVTMAMVLCLTTDIRMVQRNAFRVPSASNPIVDCSEITKDLGSLKIF